MLLLPLVLVTMVLRFLVPSLRPAAARTERLLREPVSLAAVQVCALLIVGYCALNLWLHGYIGISLGSAELSGDYQENILLRTQMTGALGTLHFSFL